MTLRSSTDATELADIYRHAAKALEDKAPGWHGEPSEYGCEAIEVAGGSRADCERMRLLFSNGGLAWLSDGSDIEHERPHRIVALCFMAAMVEAGDA